MLLDGFHGGKDSVLIRVRVTHVKLNLYRLEINGEIVCEIDTDYEPFGMARPQLSRTALRTIVAEALRRYFARPRIARQSEVVRA